MICELAKILVLGRARELPCGGKQAGGWVTCACLIRKPDWSGVKRDFCWGTTEQGAACFQKVAFKCKQKVTRCREINKVFGKASLRDKEGNPGAEEKPHGDRPM